MHKKTRSVLSLFLTLIMISAALVTQPITAMCASVDDIVLYPTDGRNVYCGETLIFSANIPFDAGDVGFDLPCINSERKRTPSCSGGL